MWKLVYHDCVVSTWYWADFNNLFPSQWRKRDLFNALYGTPPMYIAKDEKEWLRFRDEIVESYKFLQPVLSATAFAAMTDHRSLSEDGLLQMSKFDNGTTVIVNFSKKTRKQENNSIPPESYKLTSASASP